MELPESNSSHWKSKFIDGLPMLFAERIRNTLRGPNVSINYEAYTYGNLIKVVTQEGLALCNEIKLNQQVKKYHLTERQQLGEFYQRVSALENPKLLPIEDSQTLPDGDFLKTLEEAAHQHFYAKFTILIDYNYKKEFTALIDSGAGCDLYNQKFLIRTVAKLPDLSLTKILNMMSLSKCLQDGRMASRGSSSSFRGIGGRNSPRGRGNVLVQIGNQRLISLSITNSSFSSMNTDEQTYQEFLEFMKFKSNKQGDNEVPSYSSILKDDNENTELYERNKIEKVIISPEKHDLRWKDNPWQLMQRYLDNTFYAVVSYKYHNYYQSILSTMGSAEI
ncbi:uncharacterized protein LOC124898500 [Capsicum annuum]|uniref:uncharacterized protein LOC124898500 n=1 Tax=Capsicum annuum TaxID=4072 RepID=UPI001FB18EF9|nr:uncharacterized protein LOC124898500 [Capsicum annuum]